MITTRISVTGLLLLFGLLLSDPPAQAELKLMAESRHQQFSTYGLFIDHQTSLLWRGVGRAWGAVGGNIALLSYDEWPGKPQLIVQASVNASFKLKPAFGGLETESLDARAGLALDFTLSDRTRFSVGWTHYSGHMADGSSDLDLFAPNLGYESIWARFVLDVKDCFRFGGTLRPFVGMDPAGKYFAADQFAEWFFVPSQAYVALGLEEYGFDSLRDSFNAQVGYLVGNHFKALKTSSLRTVLGYYTGVDPRMKHAAFRATTGSFGYVGLMFDI